MPGSRFPARKSLERFQIRPQPETRPSRTSPPGHSSRGVQHRPGPDRPAPEKPTSRPVCDARHPARPPGPVRDRHRLGRPGPRSPTRMAGRPVNWRLRRRPDHRGRSRIHPVRTGRREPVLPARLITLRTRLADPDLEPAVRPLGRCVRRPGRRLSHDRPNRPPRRSHHPQRLQLPTQTCADRLAALDKTGKSGRITNVNVAHFSTCKTAHFSTSADTGHQRFNPLPLGIGQDGSTRHDPSTPKPSPTNWGDTP